MCKDEFTSCAGIEQMHNISNNAELVIIIFSSNGFSFINY